MTLSLTTTTKLKGLRLFVASAVIASLYIASAKLGLMLAFSAREITAVWPPTGIALAAVLLLGNRILPAIALGAFVTNYSMHEPLAAALGITAGNTLEAWVAALMMRRFTRFNTSFSRLHDVIGLLVFSGLCGTMLSANIGVISLCLSGVQQWNDYKSLWLLWWMGDAAGALVVAPVLLVWSRPPRRLENTALRVEFAALILTFLLSRATIFALQWESTLYDDHPGRTFIYLIFPFIVWSALRFGQHVTTLITFLASASVVIFYAAGFGGAYGSPLMQETFILIQMALFVLGTTGLFLGAVVTEREQAVNALRLANKRKNDFIAMLAHELRNQISPISHASQLLQLGISSEKATEMHNMIGRQLQQIIRLTEDLLDVTRIAHGKVELRREKVAVADAISNALDAIKPLMQSSNHRLSVRLPQETMIIDADPARLQQILVNLLGNAAKYTPSGGIIAISAAAEDGMAVVRITDNGVGIPSSVLPQIFDLYTQADYSSELSRGGLGIGLTLVRRLVELHGGKVNAVSAGSFKGSEFTVWLPLDLDETKRRISTGSPVLTV